MMLMRRRFSADTPELRCLTRLLRRSVATTDRIVRISTAMLGFGAVAVVMSDPPDWITLALAMSVCALVVRVTIPAAIAADEARIGKLQLSFEGSHTAPPPAPARDAGMMASATDNGVYGACERRKKAEAGKWSKKTRSM